MGQGGEPARVRDRTSFQIVYPLSADAVGDEIRAKAQSGRASLRFFLGDDEKRRRAFAGCVNVDRVIGILDGGELVGMASFAMAGKGPLSPTTAQFAKEYGPLKGLFNFLVFKLTEPRSRESDLYVYNVQVAAEARGRGVGGALMDAIESIARSSACRSISLQVAAHNTAIILYVKKGYVVTGTLRPGPLRRFFPFSCLVNMSRALVKPTKAKMVMPRPVQPAA